VIAARVLSVIALLLVSASASAQPARPRPPAPRAQVPPSSSAPTERIHVELDGIYHAATQSLSDIANPTVYAERGALTADYDVPAGPGFSGSIAYRVWRNLGVGVSASGFSTSFPAALTGSIPNPFLFNRARTFDGSVDDLERTERALGVHLRGFFRLSPKFAVSAFAGPTRLSVTQDVVTAIQYSEAYPYDTATFRAAQITTDEVNKWGVGAGADLAFFVTRRIGVGLGIKYNGGEVELLSLGGAPLQSKLGGVEFGGGLRLKF